MRLDLTPEQKEELDLLLRKEIITRRGVLDKLWDRYQETKVMDPLRASILKDSIRVEEQGKDTLEKIQRKLIPVAGQHIT